jgi:hypothetical protein
MSSGRRHWSRLSARFCCTHKSWSLWLKIFTILLINKQAEKYKENSLVIAVAVIAFVKAKNDFLKNAHKESSRVIAFLKKNNFVKTVENTLNNNK